MTVAVSPLLRVEALSVRLPTRGGLVTIVDGVDYQVESGQVFGLAGESGSGKTVSVLALLGLLPAGAVLEGRAELHRQDLLAMSRRALREVRGRRVAMVFQDPMTSLHPMMTIGRQLTEHVRYHLGLSSREARERAADLLGQVRIPDPRGALTAYPHQFSGGMRQRIAIAIALACEPQLLIADEPTTALDVTVQAGILRLLDQLRRRSGLAVILITHDLGVLSAIADCVTVMYAGRVVESGPTAELMRRPRHPYTAGLLAALPHPEAAEDTPLTAVPGSPPSPAARPLGCAFHPRCAYAVATCRSEVPALVEIEDGRRLACPVDPLLPLPPRGGGGPPGPVGGI
ncbi:MAG TPA: ABC transporter ATP-binding protein [Candidatus Dormibacteraeota bacterium]|nr:ABC transporter ATP-binding protein [Candidatus Dormibacteraeota bacterium]